jgi:hypothetical protein
MGNKFPETKTDKPKIYRIIRRRMDKYKNLYTDWCGHRGEPITYDEAVEILNKCEAKCPLDDNK